MELTPNKEMQMMIRYLEISYTSCDKNERENTEEQLSQLQNNPSHFCNIALEIIHLPIAKEIKLSAIILLNRIIEKHLLMGTFSQEKIIEVIKQYINSMISENIDDSLINNINNGFLILLNSLEDYPNVLIELTSIVNSNKLTISTKGLNGLIKILDTISLSDALTYNNINCIVRDLMQIAKYIYKSVNEFISFEISNQQSTKRFMLYCDIICNLFKFLYSFVFKVTKRLNTPQALNEVYFFIVKGYTMLIQGEEKLIISWTGNFDYDNAINRLRIKIFKFINFILSVNKNLVDNKEIYDIVIHLFNVVVENLNWVVNYKIDYIMNIEDISENEDEGEKLNYSNIKFPNCKYSLIITHMLLFINNMISQCNMRNIIDKEMEGILKNTLIPFLLITQKEIELLECNNITQSESFNILLTDAIESNISKNIKSATALLIKTIIESPKYNDYLFDYLVSFTVKTNNLNSIGNNMMIINKNDNKIKILLNSNNNNKHIDRIRDLIIFALCLISFEKLTKNKRSQLIDIYNFLSKSSSSLYIKHKLCLLIKCTNSIFIENNIYSHFEFLFENIIQNHSLILQKESCEVLLLLLLSFSQQKDSLNLLSNNIEKYYPSIIAFIPKITIIEFLNIVEFIHVKLSSNSLQIKIFEEISKRINNDLINHYHFKEQENKEPTYDYNFNLFIIKCFNIIQKQLLLPNFANEQIGLIEKLITPLFIFIGFDYDDELIGIMVNISTQMQIYIQIGISFLDNISKVKNINKYYFELYHIINYYLINDKYYIEKNEGKNSIIILSIIKSVLTKANGIKINKLYFCVLMQMWFIHSTSISNNIIIDIINIAMENMMILYNKKTTAKLEYNDICSYIGFLSIIYCSLVNYSSICINMHLNININDLIKWMEGLFDFDLPKIEMRILIICLCSIIKQNIFANKNNVILYFAFRMIEIKEKKDNVIRMEWLNEKEGKNESNLDYSYEDDGEILDSEGDGEIEEEDCYDLIEIINNPVLKVDEYKVFKESMQFILSNYPHLYHNFLMLLNEEQKIKVRSISLEENKGNIYKEDFHIAVKRKLLGNKRKRKKKYY